MSLWTVKQRIVDKGIEPGDGGIVEYRIMCGKGDAATTWEPHERSK